MSEFKTMVTNGISIDQYRIAVDFLASSKSDLVFPNSSIAHAGVVLSAMFKYSDKVVRIYDDSLDGDIAHNDKIFLDEIKNHLQKNRVLKIVVRDDQQFLESPTYLLLRQFIISGNTNLQIRKASQKFATDISAIYSKDINFAVGDSNSVRIEEDVSTPDQNQRKAICSFYRTKWATKLATTFDSCFDSCPPMNFN